MTAHSSFGSRRLESRDCSRQESSWFPYPALPAQPEISETIDMELCGEEEEEVVVCGRGQIREVTSGHSEAVSLPGFRRSPRDIQPGTQLVSGGRSSAPAIHHGPRPGLTGPVSPKDYRLYQQELIMEMRYPNVT